jgi:WD40 repeat protein
MPSDFLTSSFKIWNIAERRVLAMFKGHTSPVYSVDFSPDGRFLVSGSSDNSVRIWRMRDGSSKKLLDTNMSLIYCTALSPDGRYVAAANYDGMLRIWDFRSGQLLERWKAKGCCTTSVFCGIHVGWKGLLSGGEDKTEVLGR